MEGTKKAAGEAQKKAAPKSRLCCWTWVMRRLSPLPQGSRSG